MPPYNTNAATTISWLGNPPVVASGFAFANGDFYAEASGQNWHRRATPEELARYISSGCDNHLPAHWFEAQLIHYGLEPSKSRSVDRMRLYHAVKSGELKVPTYLASLESKLSNEWATTRTEATALETKDTLSAITANSAGDKRKANANGNAPFISAPCASHGTTKIQTATSKATLSSEVSSNAATSTGNDAAPIASATTPNRRRYFARMNAMPTSSEPTRAAPVNRGSSYRRRYTARMNNTSPLPFTRAAPVNRGALTAASTPQRSRGVGIWRGASTTTHTLQRNPVVGRGRLSQRPHHVTLGRGFFLASRTTRQSIGPRWNVSRHIYFSNTYGNRIGYDHLDGVNSDDDSDVGDFLPFHPGSEDE